MVYIGILEQSNFLKNNADLIEKVELFLSGRTYNDLSPNQHPVSIVGDVPLIEDSYNITKTSNVFFRSNYLEVPNSFSFDLADNYFYFEFEIKSIEIGEINVTNMWSSNTRNRSFAISVKPTIVGFSLSSNVQVSGSLFSYTYPDLNNGEWHKIKIERNRSISAPLNSDAILFYYNDLFLGERTMRRDLIANFSNNNLTMGKRDIGNRREEDYLIKNIKIVRYIR